MRPYPRLDLALNECVNLHLHTFACACADPSTLAAARDAQRLNTDA